jgi:hypothetical protein
MEEVEEEVKAVVAGWAVPVAGWAARPERDRVWAVWGAGRWPDRRASVSVPSADTGNPTSGACPALNGSARNAAPR